MFKVAFLERLLTSKKERREGQNKILLFLFADYRQLLWLMMTSNRFCLVNFDTRVLKFVSSCQEYRQGESIIGLHRSVARGFR